MKYSEVYVTNLRSQIKNLKNSVDYWHNKYNELWEKSLSGGAKKNV